MANEIGKFKVCIEFDGENVITECKGKALDVCVAISTLLVEITEDVPDPLLRRTIIKSICQTALENIEPKKEEGISIEDIISKIFKN